MIVPPHCKFFKSCSSSALPADNRFLVICALVSDLYCPGYNPRQPLEKNSNLARTAARYKLDSAKLAASARAELSRPKTKVKEKTQPESRKTSNSR